MLPFWLRQRTMLGGHADLVCHRVAASVQAATALSAIAICVERLALLTDGVDPIDLLVRSLGEARGDPAGDGTEVVFSLPGNRRFRSGGSRHLGRLAVGLVVQLVPQLRVIPLELNGRSATAASETPRGIRRILLDPRMASALVSQRFPATRRHVSPAGLYDCPVWPDCGYNNSPTATTPPSTISDLLPVTFHF